jgi:hypothetical protein
MSRDLKMTLRFVVLIATPLCLVNSLVFSFGSVDFLADWFGRFTQNYVITFPQAVLYVSAIKWYDRRKSNQ